jgi:hypothetical protein
MSRTVKLKAVAIHAAEMAKLRKPHSNAHGVMA